MPCVGCAKALGRVKRRDGHLRDVPDLARLLQLNSLVQPEPVGPAADLEQPVANALAQDRLANSETETSSLDEKVIAWTFRFVFVLNFKKTNNKKTSLHVPLSYCFLNLLG